MSASSADTARAPCICDLTYISSRDVLHNMTCRAGPYISALYPKSPNPKALARAMGASTGDNVLR
jgi:hypothetical protein